MSASFTEYYLQLFDTRLRAPIADSTGTVLVLTAGTAAYASLFSDPLGVSAVTQPLVMTGGVIRFFIASSVASVDMVVLTANGFAKYLRGVTPSMGRIDIDPDQVGPQYLYLPFTLSASNVTLSVGFSLSQSMRVRDAYVRVSGVDATGTLSVGTTTAGLASFLLAATCSVTGIFQANESLSGQSLGSALSATATDGYQRLYHRPANATSALPIQLTTAATASGTSSTNGNGFAILVYDRVPSA